MLKMRDAGFSLVELMVTIVIAAVLLGLGLGSVRTMMNSTYTRAAADSIVAGLQMAKSEAIRRNTPMRFQLVSTLTNSCAYSSTSALWVASQTDQVTRGQVAGACAATPYIPPDQPDPCNPDPGVCVTPGSPANCRPAGNSATCSTDPWIAMKSSSETSPSITVSAATASGSGTAASIVTFGPIGQVLANLDPGSGVPPTLGYVSIAPVNDTEAKTWGVRISSNGSVKLCDPSKASTDPMAC